MAAGPDVLEAAIEVARAVRSRLADALIRLDANPTSKGPEPDVGSASRTHDVCGRATRAIGALYAIEIGNAAQVDDGFAEASGILCALLEDLEGDSPEVPFELRSAIAHALARLHPARLALSQAQGFRGYAEDALD